MATYWIWWALAVVLVGAELFTGTFYLLAVGGAFALGGVAAWLGGSTPVQLLIGGVSGVAGTIAAHQWRKLHAMPAPQAALDVGQEVQVLAWHDNGTARVNYREPSGTRKSRRRRRRVRRRCTSSPRAARRSSSHPASPDRQSATVRETASS